MKIIMKKGISFVCFILVTTLSLAQVELKLEILPKEGSVPKLGKEFWVEAWLTNTTSEPIRVFKIGYCEPGWGGYENTWAFSKDGVPLKLSGFGGATEKFSEKYLLLVGPGEKIYAGLFRRQMEEPGKYRIDLKLSADPGNVNLNYAANPIAKEWASKIVSFRSSASYEYEIKGVDFTNVNVQRQEISKEELMKKPTYKFFDAFEKPDDVYKLEVTGNVTQEQLNQVAKFQNVRMLVLRDLSNVTTLPENLSQLDLQSLVIGKIDIYDYPASYANWKNMTSITFESYNSETYPMFVKHFENLEYLILYSDKLKEIPEGISNHKKLKTMYIDGNNQPFKFPKDLSRVTTLEQLTITDLKLEEIPGIWNNPKLKKIALLNTGISSISESISLLTSLQEIFIFKSEVSALPEGISKLEKLEQVTFSNCKFTEFPKVLYASKSIKKLNLSQSQVETMAEGIESMSNLEQLLLDRNDLKELPEGLSKCPKLSQVSVKGNKSKISGNGRKLIKARLKTGYKE